MERKAYKCLLVILNIGVYTLMFMSGIHLKFWEMFSQGHIGTIMVLSLLALLVLPARLLVYFASKWGTSNCNPMAFVIGLMIFAILHVFPSTRELFYFRPAITISTVIIILTDIMVALSYFQRDEWNNQPVE